MLTDKSIKMTFRICNEKTGNLEKRLLPTATNIGASNVTIYNIKRSRENEK